jgi:hypothetical protein
MLQMRGSASPLLASVKPPFVEWTGDGMVLVHLLWLLTATATVIPAVAKMTGLFGERRSA